MSQQESKEFLNDLWKKGEDTQREIDEKIKKKAKEMIGELNLATKEEVRELERRIQVLENKQNDS
ncbi:ATP synthase [Halalkalibacter wakoensis JCM 9140]|uniref:ATP synthase n=1 Tax=Halalkalibacter wakoensis JCM 9140 TaxID=1236970 RepID=W4Q449_9BACI|nr:ATP synthase [Halalkalibacter wakoensis JCM 9140]